MDTLNQGAHNSFSTMLTTISVVRSKAEEWQPRIKKHVEHWQKYVEYLNHIEQLFRAGRKKEDVLQATINMHRSICFLAKSLSWPLLVLNILTLVLGTDPRVKRDLHSSIVYAFT
jgi:hypothetical protein